jgi:hypothetical protein
MGILLLRTCTLKFIKYLKFITMASKHQLSLELPDTNNIKVLRIFDTSIYADGVGQDCGVLSITSPGFNLPVNIEMLPGFNTTLTACTLGLQKT